MHPHHTNPPKTKEIPDNDFQKINRSTLNGDDHKNTYSFFTKAFYTEVYTANNWHHLLPYKTSINRGSHHQQDSSFCFFGFFFESWRFMSRFLWPFVANKY